MIVKDLEQWHAIVCAAENFICRICKKDFSYELYFQEDGNRRVNQYVTGHHIKTQKAFPELRLNTENGCCVCKDCHTKIHKGLVEIPDLLRKMAESHARKSAQPQTLIKFEPDHILPNGRGITLRSHEKLCKCKKYIAQEVTGICMGCEKHRPSNFKTEKKPEKKKF